jgi:NADH dehydrogenase
MRVDNLLDQQAFRFQGTSQISTAIRRLQRHLTMKLLVTGATGYIGQPFVSLAAAKGHTIVCASRRPGPKTHEWIAYDLRDRAPAFPPDVDAVIHLAADTSGSGMLAPEEEIAAARRLIEYTQRASAKLIFISSQTSGSEANTAYGRTKWLIEQDVLATSGTVVRPGQVYGGAERGLFGVLCKLVRQVPLLPILLPAPLVQPIHVDDLAAAILTIAEQPQKHEQVICLGAAQPISFGRFLRSIAADRLRKVRLPVPVPVVLLKLMGLLLGPTLSARLGLSRIFSLTSLPPLDSARSLQELNIEVRPLAQGMHRSGDGRRRLLLQEGAILLSYLLKQAPSAAMTRRYVRALEHTDQARAITQSQLLVRWPILMTLLDTPRNLATDDGRELAQRLLVALSIAEASPLGAKAFLGNMDARSPFGLLFMMGMTTLKELLWRMLGLICNPVIRPLFFKAGGKREA